VEVSNQNINPMLSDNEEEKNERIKKEEELKTDDEPIQNEPIPSKNIAFQIFKQDSNQAKEIENGIIKTSDELKKSKAEAKNFLEICNNLKSKIESLKVVLNEKKLNKLNLGDDMTELIDEEGYKLIDEMKSVKAEYKDYLDKFKVAKSEINSFKNNLDMLKVKYVESFEAWFFKKYGIKVEDHELKLRKVREDNKNF